MNVPVLAGISKIDALAIVLEKLDLAGLVVTADALHTRTDTATHLVEERRADDVENP